MITVVYCTREHNQKHIDHLKKMAGHPKVQVIEYINNGVSLTKAYNALLKKAEFDVVVFCHDDIEVQTKQFAKKIKNHYDNSEYGILGVAGTKFLADNGRWWQDRSAMYGRVWHTHQGKKTISKYSPDQNTDIEETIVVDGVFFSVMKSRLKHNFDESVEGFHFYDIDFCFKNYLDGVKIGVHTNISINHMSIGETNDEWEVNRGLFAEKYKDNLPVKIDKVYKDSHKFRILIASITMELAFDLAKQLQDDGHFVTVTSQLNEEVLKLYITNKIDFFPLDTPRGFVKGDGKFEINTPNGPIKSEAGKLYKFKSLKYDIIHTVGPSEPIENVLSQFFPEIPYRKIDKETTLDSYVDEYKKVLA